MFVSCCSSMEKKANFLFLLLLFFLITATTTCSVAGIRGTKRLHNGRQQRGTVKLFVFGDSYVDTGNFNKHSGSWLEPNGNTFPGKPSGRFSDGRVLTDYIASFLGIKTPIAYKWRRAANKTQLERGMNFAQGGTGVFDTWAKGPNMTTQINQLKLLLDELVFTKHDLQTSVAVVSVSGNDYDSLSKNNGTLKEVPALTRRIIDQLAKNLQSIGDLGVRKISVLAMEPMGCLPLQTKQLSYLSCNKSLNSVSRFHNKLLRQAVQNLNKKNKNSAFVCLDVYRAFISALKHHHHRAGNTDYSNPLKPCQTSVTRELWSWGGEGNDKKEHVICKQPELSFFWDMLHPSQNGWRSIYLALRRRSLPQLKK